MAKYFVTGDCDTCSICRTDYKDTPGEAVRMLSRCRHKFHDECLREALRHRAQCPICGDDTRSPFWRMAVFVSKILFCSMVFAGAFACASLQVFIVAVEAQKTICTTPPLVDFPCNVSQINAGQVDSRVCDIAHILWPAYLDNMRDDEVHPNEVEVFETLRVLCANRLPTHWSLDLSRQRLALYSDMCHLGFLWQQVTLECEMRARGNVRIGRHTWTSCEKSMSNFDACDYWGNVQPICGVSGEPLAEQ